MLQAVMKDQIAAQGTEKEVKAYNPNQDSR